MNPTYFEKIKEKHLLLILYILAGAIFFLPLLTGPGFYYPFVTIRNFYFRIAVEFMVFFYVILVLKSPMYLRQKNFLWKIFLSFILALTFSSIINGDFLYSFWSTIERMDGLITLYHEFAYFFILASIIRTRRAWETILQVNLFAAIIVFFVGLSQVLGMNFLLASSSGARITSALGNPTYLSAYLLLEVFFALYFLLKDREASDMTVYKYGFLVLDIFILALQALYSVAGRGILQEIFSNFSFWVPFAVFHLLAYSQYFAKFKEKFFPYVHSIFYSFLVFNFLFLIFKTETRGAFAGLVLGIVFGVLVILFKKSFSRKIKITAAGVSVFVILSIAAIFVFSNSPIVKNNRTLARISLISLSDVTTRTRLLTWGAAMRGFLEKPVFGWGAENFYRVFDKYFPPEIYRNMYAIVWFDRPHNIILQNLVDGGLAAFALYAAMLVSLLNFLVKNLHPRFSVLFSAYLFSYLGQNMFVFDSLNSSFLFYGTLGFFFCLKDQSIPPASQKFEQNFRKFRESYLLPAVFLWFVGVFFVLWQANIIPAKTNRNFLKHHLALSRGENAKEHILPMLNILENSPYLGRAEYTALLAEKTGSLIQDNDISNFDAARVLPGLEASISKMLEIRPHEVRMKILAMNFYLNSSRLNPEKNPDKVLGLRDSAIALSPSRSQIYTASGKAYMLKKMNSFGIDDYRQAKELAPWVYEARHNLFVAYLSSNLLAQARQEAVEMLNRRGSNPEIFKNIIGLYFQFDYAFSEAKLFGLEAVKRFPQDPELFLLLAQSHKGLGENELARKAVEKAIDIDPSYKEKGDAIIQTLQPPTKK